MVLGDPNPRRHRASLRVGSVDAVVQAHRKGTDGGVVLLRRSLRAIISSAPPDGGIASEVLVFAGACQWNGVSGLMFNSSSSSALLHDPRRS